MSKAFKGEDASEAPVVVPPRAPLPAGVPNYVTASGLAALRVEHERLLVDRARLEASAGESDRAHALATAAARLAALEDRLASAQLVTSAGGEEARFGATVTVRGEDGETRRYRIVGVDEADAAQGQIAFVAPLARALLGKRPGDVFVLRSPRGDEELEVVRMEHEE